MAAFLLLRSSAPVAMSLLGVVAGCVRAQQPGAVYPAGVTAAMHAASEGGTNWLLRHQSGDGSWRSAGVQGTYPVAMTSMAAMSLLTGGSAPTRGRHYAAVRGAVAFLKRNADANTGLIAIPAEDGHTMYAHGFATLFLASVSGMEEDAREHEALRRILRRAVSLIEAAQTPSGGWNYTPTAGFDEGSVTVTQIQALRACRMAGIQVSKKTIDQAIDYIRRCQNDDGGIRYRFGIPGESRPAISAAGVAVFYNAGVYDDRDFVDRAVRFCQQRIRVGVDDGHEYYAQHYWGQALYQRGGADWRAHFEKVGAWLLRDQKPDGSWDGDGVGPVYGTAIALTLLQLPYAYVPIYQR